MSMWRRPWRIPSPLELRQIAHSGDREIEDYRDAALGLCEQRLCHGDTVELRCSLVYLEMCERYFTAISARLSRSNLIMTLGAILTFHCHA